VVQPAGVGEPPHRRPATKPGGLAAAVGGLQLAQQLAVDQVAGTEQDLDVDGQVGHGHNGQVLGGPGEQRAGELGQLPSNVVSNIRSTLAGRADGYQP